MKPTLAPVLIAVTTFALAACEAKKSEAPAPSGTPTMSGAPKEPKTESAPPPAVLESTLPVKPEKEPEHVVVQHILIAFEGSGTKATRSKADAEKLANEVFAKARSGENFDELVKKYTDDSPPGKYAMANVGVTPNKAKGEYPRNGMVGAFGNVGFAISVGNIDMAPYHPATSKYGWHIIKRLE